MMFSKAKRKVNSQAAYSKRHFHPLGRFSITGREGACFVPLQKVASQREPFISFAHLLLLFFCLYVDMLWLDKGDKGSVMHSA